MPTLVKVFLFSSSIIVSSFALGSGKKSCSDHLQKRYEILSNYQKSKAETTNLKRFLTNGLYSSAVKSLRFAYSAIDGLDPQIVDWLEELKATNETDRHFKGFIVWNFAENSIEDFLKHLSEVILPSVADKLPVNYQAESSPERILEFVKIALESSEPYVIYLAGLEKYLTETVNELKSETENIGIISQWIEDFNDIETLSFMILSSNYAIREQRLSFDVMKIQRYTPEELKKETKYMGHSLNETELEIFMTETDSTQAAVGLLSNFFSNHGSAK